jgi:hyperosmotically inducible protein
MSIKLGIMRASLLAVSCAAALSACAATPAHESTGAAIDDAAITAKVKAALVADPATKARDIHVKTYHGVVQLSGFVNSKDERDDAMQLASHQAGVQHVDDEMQITPASTEARATDDSDITDRVKSALDSNPDTQHGIDVTTHDGVVQLYGFVNSRDQIDEAGKLARGVEGVRKVDNALKVKPGD